MPGLFEGLEEALDMVNERYANEEIDFNTYYEWVNELEEKYGYEEI